MVFSKSKRLSRLLLIVSFVVAPLSRELRSSEYSRTVSYTHLDVYKIQVCICSRRTIDGFFRPKSSPKMMCEGRYFFFITAVTAATIIVGAFALKLSEMCIRARI